MKLKLVHEVKIWGFFHGVILGSCFDSLYQDLIGKQAYINQIQNNWIDSRITIPLAIIMTIATVIHLIYKANKQVENEI